MSFRLFVLGHVIGASHALTYRGHLPASREPLPVTLNEGFDFANCSAMPDMVTAMVIDVATRRKDEQADAAVGIA